MKHPRETSREQNYTQCLDFLKIIRFFKKKYLLPSPLLRGVLACCGGNRIQLLDPFRLRLHVGTPLGLETPHGVAWRSGAGLPARSLAHPPPYPHTTLGSTTLPIWQWAAKQKGRKSPALQGEWTNTPVPKRPPRFPCLVGLVQQFCVEYGRV